MAWTAESAASAGQGEPLDVVGTGTGTAAISAGRLAQALWQENADLAQAALEHPFVRGIADGTLPRQAFQGYVAQDAFFLTAFARAYALALARSPDQATARLFSELLSGTMDELRLHAGYASRWAITLDGVVPNEATLAYTDFLLATAALGGVGETCAALTPCMRLYAFLGQSLAAGRSSGRSSGRSGGPPNDVNPYAEWIRTYAAPGFDTLAAQLEALLNQHAAGNTAVRTIYRRAMRLEVAFFDASARAVE
ncbi:MAG: TenA family protein [Chloroflexi bacterium]|nr:TenA family protein [Chloroflexota bacterium]